MDQRPWVPIKKADIRLNENPKPPDLKRDIRASFPEQGNWPFPE
jgi:hypothetical protein